jgi:translocation and assembly module TamB
MSEEAEARPGRRRWWKIPLLVLVSLAPVLAGLRWYTTTDSFQAMIRRRLVAELERVTGGRVELESIHTMPFELRVDVRGLTIHGRESANDIPYAHVDRLAVQLKIISLLGAEFGFRSVVLDRPVLHIIFHPDGTTNQPTPRIRGAGASHPLEQLFALSITRLQVRGGTLLWGDQTVPLDFTAEDILADMSYSFLFRRFESSLRVGKGGTKVKDWRPFSWMADARFALGRNSLEVRSLKVTSGHSQITANGKLDDFQRPKINLTYNILLDLSDAAAIGRQPEIRHGTFQAEGHGAWSLEDFSSAGRVWVKDFEGRDRNAALSGAALAGQFSVTPERLALAQMQARLLGGTVLGDLEISNWLPPTAGSPVTKARAASEQKGTVRLRFRDIAVADLFAALAPSLPVLPRLRLAGNGGGTAELRWAGPLRNSEVQVSADVTSPNRVRSGDIPLSAHLRATYRGTTESLEIADLTASTPAGQLQAVGTLSSNTAMRFSASTTDLAEWRPVCALLGYPRALPVMIHGHASLSGTAWGKLSALTLAGNVQAEDFDVQLPATRYAPSRRVHWDSLTTFVQASAHTVAFRGARLHHGAALVSFDGSAHVQNGQIAAGSPFAAHLDIHQADVSEILALAGFNYPIRGLANVRIQVSGTRADPHGEGHLELTDLLIDDRSVRRLVADLRLSNGEASLNNIRLAHGAAEISGGATYNLSSHAFRFNFAGEDFDLARIPELQSAGHSVEGGLGFTAQGSGTREHPVLQISLRLRDLTVDHERSGNLTVEAVSQGDVLHVTGSSELERGDLTLDGELQPRGDWLSNLTLQFSHLDVDPLLRAHLPGRLTGHSAATGVIRLSGPFLRPADLSVTGDLNGLSLDVENVKLDNQGPVRFSVARRILTLEQVHLVGERTDLSASGNLHLSGARELDVQAQGRVNLRLMETLNRDFTSSGVLTANLNLAGTLSQPVLQGRMEIVRGSIAYIDLPSALSDINGSVTFTQSRIQVETLTAHTGGGEVSFTGSASLYNGQLHFDLGVQGKEVRLRYPPGVSSTADMTLHFAGTPQSSTLSGDVTVTKLSMTPGFDFAAYLQRSVQANALPQIDPLLNRIHLDLHITTTPELEMQTASLRLSGDADMRLRGTAAKPALLGRADILEGEVYFNGTKYRLDRGAVTFLSPVTIKPVLDLQATTRVRDYDITLSVNGEPDKLNVTYRAEPPLPSADIIALLALGRTREESAQLQENNPSPFAQEASNAILTEALNSTVSNRVQRLFGGSRIKIDPEGLTTETSTLARGPAVTVEQQVAGNLTLTYTTNLAQASQQIIQAEYNLSRNVSIVALRDQDGVVSIDVRVRRRKN